MEGTDLANISRAQKLPERAYETVPGVGGDAQGRPVPVGRVANQNAAIHVGRFHATAAVGAGITRLPPRGAVYGFHLSAIPSIRVRDSLRR
jgi:hypothetical protein